MDSAGAMTFVESNLYSTNTKRKRAVTFQLMNT